MFTKSFFSNIKPSISISRCASSTQIENWSLDKCHKLPRIYVDQVFSGIESKLQLDEANTNYVHNVMRLRSGDYVRIFNERYGEYIAAIVGSDTRNSRRVSKLTLSLSRQLLAATVAIDSKKPQLSIYFAPVKKDKMKLIVEKATELGVNEFQPIITQNTNVDISSESMISSLKTVIIQSVEQSERLDVPLMHPSLTWGEFRNRVTEAINSSSSPTLFLLCRERSDQTLVHPLLKILSNVKTNVSKIVIVIGPEGGFTQQEFRDLETLAALATPLESKATAVYQVSLGNQVLRAETAAIASISVVSLWRDSLVY